MRDYAKPDTPAWERRIQRITDQHGPRCRGSFDVQKCAECMCLGDCLEEEEG